MEQASDALIICHINPDADALGSALSMRDMFCSLGSEAKIVCPSAPPKHLDFLTKGEKFEYEDGDIDRYSLVIAVDVASEPQLGFIAPYHDKINIMIDHHSNGEAFTDNLIEPEAAACGEIIFKIYKQHVEDGKIEPSTKIPCYLYAALSADSGSFKYSNTTPETFRIAASLMEEINQRGELSADEISRLLHDTVTKTDMRMSALVHSRLTFFEEGSLAVVPISAEDMKEANLEESDLGGAVDIPRKIEGVLACVVIKERCAQPGVYKLSSRANCDIDVAAVCEKFNGGGHTRAAGGTVHASSVEEAMEKVSEAFGAAVAKYKKETLR